MFAEWRAWDNLRVGAQFRGVLLLECCWSTFRVLQWRACKICSYWRGNPTLSRMMLLLFYQFFSSRVSAMRHNWARDTCPSTHQQSNWLTIIQFCTVPMVRTDCGLRLVTSILHSLSTRANSVELGVHTYVPGIKLQDFTDEGTRWNTWENLTFVQWQPVTQLLVQELHSSTFIEWCLFLWKQLWRWLELDGLSRRLGQLRRRLPVRDRDGRVHFGGRAERAESQVWMFSRGSTVNLSE